MINTDHLPQIHCKKVTEHTLPAPQQHHSTDAGFDLQTTINFTLYPGQQLMIPTGFAYAIPEGFCGMVCPRSGLAAKHMISVTNAPGIIDAGYRGEVKVLMINHGEQAMEFSIGDKIAQMVITPHVRAEMLEVLELSDTKRGSGGFGSTGS